MAIILKEHLTYNPSVSSAYGIDLTSADYYGVIDEIHYDKSQKTCDFAVSIYGNKDARNSSSATLENKQFTFHDADFATIGNDGLSIPDAYALALVTLVDWRSDE